jgi:hypothetical protein
MTNWKGAQPLGHRVRRIERREFIFLLAGATTAPRILRAQQKATSVIGILAPNPKVFATLTVERDLAALGWEPGATSTLWSGRVLERMRRFRRSPPTSSRRTWT